MKKLLTALVPFVLLLATACMAKPMDAAVSARFAQGHCSATFVAKHAVLTAEHCTVDEAVWSINEQPFEPIRLVAKDQRDHVLVCVDAKAPAVAKIVQRPWREAEVLRFKGMVGGLHPLYREGYVSGTMINPSGQKLEAMVAQGGPGDSGSGFFDKRGRVVGVLTGTWYLLTDTTYTFFIVAYPMNFTQEQLDLAQQCKVSDGT